MAYEDTISQMTLDEKCALLQGASAFGTFAIPSLGIPELQFSDGPHGMRHQDPEKANHLGIGGSLPATCFPTAATVAQSWDPSLGERLGVALGEEAACQGVGCVLGPGLNIKRSPLTGRNFEYFSEDPILAGKMAAAYVRGIQSQGVAACPKHFAVNSQETRRQSSDSVLDERTLRELYLTGFETVMRESDPWTIMTSYNLVNGTYANESKHLLQEILRGEWGFGGAVVTDWGGSNSHVAGVDAGSNFEMPAPGLDEARMLAAAVRDGRISQATLDARVEEALHLILRTRAAVEAKQGQKFDEVAHHQLAREIAAQSIVLLKNQAAEARGAVAGGEPLLPLAPGTSVALLGDFALAPRYQGAGSSQVNCTHIDTLAELVGAEDLQLLGVERGFTRGGEVDATLQRAAVELARKADVAVLNLGLDEVAESEGFERLNMRISDAQIALLKAVAAVNPNTVVLISAGASVETEWAVDARAMLHLALGGQAGAGAALDVLMGRVNPSGKTAETWYQHLSDNPTAGNFPSYEKTAEYREGLYVGYRYCNTADVRPAFPFGYGLSYTTFAYSDLRVEQGDSARGAGTKISFTLSNVGSVAGAEVVQLYVAKPKHEVFRPAQELKAFAKVFLQPGESRDVTLTLDETAFRYWNVATDAWETEGGTYELRVAASSEDVRLTGEVELAGTGAADPYAGLDLAPYKTGQVAGACVSDAQFAALLGRALPEAKVTIDERMTFRDLTHSRSPLLMAIGAALGVVERKALAKGTPNLNVEFVYNMPLRAIGQMTGGITDSGLVRAIVREAKGWGLGGLALLGGSVALGRGVGLGILLCLVWVFGPWAVAMVANAIKNAASKKALATADAARR
ncbi:MAG: glycoside hydrolase family 3 C-terminal domain-containing protein [Atopobiaceae bacterium]|nr:glycoside hydrolase family 3 C-terminal domain-containing protein [Atopobiaceae bacterium]